MIKYMFAVAVTALITNCTIKPGSDKINFIDGLNKQEGSCLTADDSLLIKTSVGGCGNVTVYGFIDSSHFIVVKLDMSRIPINENKTTLNLDSNYSGVNIVIYKFLPDSLNGNKGGLFFPPVCTDIDIINANTANFLIIDQIKQGVLCFSRSADEDIEGRFYCTIKLENLVMQNGEKVLVYKLSKFIFHNVLVGWNAG